MYTGFDADRKGKCADGRVIQNVYITLKMFMLVFVVFLGHFGEQTIKEGFFLSCSKNNVYIALMFNNFNKRLVVQFVCASFPNILGGVECTRIKAETV